MKKAIQKCWITQNAVKYFNIMNDISAKRILEIWKDPTFSGSYSGIKTFQILLKTDLNIDISERRLYKILKSDPIYLIHLKPVRQFDRRHYDLRFYGELLQADIAYMFNYDGFKYFLLVVDCYSSKIYVEPLKTKDSITVAQALKKLFGLFKTKIYELQSDRGKEFEGASKKLFHEEKVVYRQKLGKHKANYAESSIYLIKKRLYMCLRSQLSQNWIKFIKSVVEAHNNTPLEKLGWLRPNQIHSEYDSTLVQQQKLKFNINTFKEPNFEIQRANQKAHSKNKKKLQINDYVYLDLNEKLFDKSFDIQVENMLKLIRNMK